MVIAYQWQAFQEMLSTKNAQLTILLRVTSNNELHDVRLYIFWASAILGFVPHKTMPLRG